MAADVGDLAKTIGIEVMQRSSGEQITKGDLVSFTATGAVEVASITLLTSNIGNGFGIAMETGSSATSTVRVAVGNTYVYAAIAQGDVVPFQLVGAGSTGTVGVIALDITTITATAIVQIHAATVGRYFGHENEEDDPTAATTAEVGIIRLGL